MIISEYRLRRLIRSIIHENLNIEDNNSIQKTIKNLNSASQDLRNNLDSEGNIEDFDLYISDHLDDIIGSFKSEFEYLDDGAFRKVYALPNHNWVLKLAHNLEGAKVNRQEIQMSGIDSSDDVYHGTGARDIFVKLYDYDRVNAHPWWIICQRVVPIIDINDIELLKKIFPTFFNILNSVVYENQYSSSYKKKTVEKKLSNPYSFVEFMSKILSSSVIKSKRIKKPTQDDKGWDYLHKKQKPPYYSNLNYHGITKQSVYEVAKDYFSGNLLPIDQISFGRDIEKLTQGLAYVGTTDLHEGNIGIVKSEQPSPEDIVILDFDINS